MRRFRNVAALLLVLFAPATSRVAGQTCSSDWSSAFEGFPGADGIVHSFVEFVDGVVKAEVGRPDMRKPIQYAITEPHRVGHTHQPMDLIGTDLTFEAVDHDVFPCLELGYEAGRAGGTAPAVLNAADEVAVAQFLDGHITFADIPTVVERTLARHTPFAPQELEDVRAVDDEARAHAAEECEALRTG